MAEAARRRIPDAAIDLFGKKGIAGTTIQEIARRARCSQAAIYKYWESKDALARELFETAYGVLLAEMEQGRDAWTEPSERVLGALAGFLGHARGRPAEHAFLFQVFHSDYARWLAGRTKPSDVVRAEIERGMRTGNIPAGDPDIRTALVLGMAIRAAVFERQGMIRATPARIDEEVALAAAAALGV